MSGNRSRNGTLGLGVLLLFLDMTKFGLKEIPPVTLVAILGQVSLFLGVITVPWDKWDVCLSADKVWNSLEFRRMLLSTLEHADDMHLYFNMGSLLLKGSFLERKYWSANFSILILFFTLTTNAIYVSLALGLSYILNNPAVMESCAIGFSGVLFALKVVTTQESRPTYMQIEGLWVDSRYAPWVELIAIHFAVPNASFLGHLAGILAGVLYAKTFVGRHVDEAIEKFTGRTVEHDVYYYNIFEDD
ncbi:rhomboid-related protein 4-like [Nilaparvata lugens]|uniref:rhomboid-related protein 4-like n=1 Tax=Nilaparvata lugens TaxID=108931 RepID=UPI00193D3A59|nr:rhomboid-related protein 4-like [Nilaparvata lugens]